MAGAKARRVSEKNNHLHKSTNGLLKLIAGFSGVKREIQTYWVLVCSEMEGSI